MWTLLWFLYIHQKVLSLALGRFRIHMSQSVLYWILKEDLLPVFRVLPLCCSLLSSTLSCKSQLLRSPWSSPSHIRRFTVPSLILLLCCGLGHPLGSIVGKSCGSPHLFPVSQGSLSFVAWYPVSWKLFHVFCLFCCCHVVVSGGRVNQVPVTPSRLETDVLYRLNNFPGQLIRFSMWSQIYVYHLIFQFSAHCFWRFLLMWILYGLCCSDF